MQSSLSPLPLASSPQIRFPLRIGLQRPFYNLLQVASWWQKLVFGLHKPGSALTQTRKEFSIFLWLCQPLLPDLETQQLVLIQVFGPSMSWLLTPLWLTLSDQSQRSVRFLDWLRFSKLPTAEILNIDECQTPFAKLVAPLRENARTKMISVLCKTLDATPDEVSHIREGFRLDYAAHTELRQLILEFLETHAASFPSFCSMLDASMNAETRGFLPHSLVAQRWLEFHEQRREYVLWFRGTA